MVRAVAFSHQDTARVLRKSRKYLAFRAFWSKMLVGRMSGIFRHFLGIFGANHLVTLFIGTEKVKNDVFFIDHVVAENIHGTA